MASIGNTGDVQATTWDLKKGLVGIATLHAHFPADDHNAPGLLRRSDGRLMAFYTMHAGPRSPQRTMYFRVTTRPGDASEWDPEQSFQAGVEAGFTYANPFQLSAENSRIYLFWRAIDFNPTWSSSDDLGKTWRPGANHIYYKANERPYVKYASNGVDTIHFAFTDGHPDRAFKNSLWHAYYKNGGLYRSDGSFVRKLSDGPIQVSEATRIYDGVTSASGEAWVWDMHLDKAGMPVIVYSSHPSPMDQRYRYARWNGKAWEDHQIAFAGKRLYEQEPYYAGGICLDPDDLRVVYLSSDVNIVNGEPNTSGHWEIYRGVTRDGGKSWRWEPVTSGSRQDNLRPIVPANHPGGMFVLWFRGKYTAYTKFETEIVARTGAKLPPVTQRISWTGAGAGN
ncbi:MAG: BNR repeat-containing protein [Acidobacteria bacterium]|nr:BNR repeat-containing protein [Acidobacteriota bacterium]